MKKPLKRTDIGKAADALTATLHLHERFIVIVTDESGLVRTATNLIPEVATAVMLRHLSNQATERLSAPSLDLGDTKIQ